MKTNKKKIIILLFSIFISIVGAGALVLFSKINKTDSGNIISLFFAKERAYSAYDALLADGDRHVYYAYNQEELQNYLNDSSYTKKTIFLMNNIDIYNTVAIETNQDVAITSYPGIFCWMELKNTLSNSDNELNSLLYINNENVKVMLVNFGMNNAGQGGNCITLNSCGRLYMDSCFVQEAPMNGIYMKNCYNTQNLISNSYFQNNGYTGISMLNDSYMLARDTEIFNNGYNEKKIYNDNHSYPGIMVTDNNVRLYLDSCRVYDNSGQGISVGDTWFNTVLASNAYLNLKGTHIYHNGFSGVCSFLNNTIEADSSFFHSNGNQGFELNGTSNASVKNCNFDNNTNCGICIADNSKLSLEPGTEGSNSVYSNGENGIETYGNSLLLINDCNINSNANGVAIKAESIGASGQAPIKIYGGNINEQITLSADSAYVYVGASNLNLSIFCSHPWDNRRIVQTEIDGEYDYINTLNTPEYHKICDEQDVLICNCYSVITIHKQYDLKNNSWNEYYKTSATVSYGTEYTPQYVTPPTGFRCYQIDKGDIIYSDRVFYAYYYPNSYIFTVNCYCSGSIYKDFSNIGTFDVYIDEQLVADNVSSFSQYCLYGQSYKVEDAKAKEGYTYEGVFAGGLSGVLSSNYTVTLKYDVINYKITYDLGGGIVSPANRIQYNILTATFTLNNPTKTGFKFLGWTGSNGNVPESDISIVKGTTGNKMFIANWKAIIFKQTIEHYIWKPITGSWELWTTTYHDGEYGKIFTPRYTNPPTGYHADYIDSEYIVSGEKTVKAYYYPNEYRMNFNGNGGICEYESKSVLFNDYYGNLPEATRDYCTFAGWYLSPHLFISTEEAAYVSDMVTEQSVYNVPNDLMVYAGWFDTGVPKIEVIPIKPEDKDFDGTWRKKPIEMDISASDTGFSNLVYFSLKCETNGDVIFEESYGEPIKSASKHIVIGNRDTKEYEGVYDWIITVMDSSGNVSTTTFRTKLDFTPPVIMDVAGEYDSNGTLITKTVQKYRDSDDIIEQMASDDNPSVNAVSGIKYFCLYLTSQQNTFINHTITPYISSSPFVIKYDFVKNTDEEELGVILYAIDVAGNSSSRIVTPEAGINHMIRRTVPRKNYD